MTDAPAPPRGHRIVPRFPKYAVSREGKLRRLARGRWVVVSPSATNGNVVLRSSELGRAQIAPATVVTMTYGFEDLPGERWREVDGWPLYEVSDHGRVRRQRRWALRLLKPVPNPDGSLRVDLCDDGHTETHFVHHLVLEVFGPERCEDQVHGRHKDADPSHNHIENLEWATKLESMAHASERGTIAAGERHGNARLTQKEALEIYRSSASNTDLAAVYGVSDRQIEYIKKGQRWSSVTGHGRTVKPDGAMK